MNPRGPVRLSAHAQHLVRASLLAGGALLLGALTACSGPPPPPVAAPPPLAPVLPPPAPGTAAPAPPPPPTGRVRTTEFTVEGGVLKLPTPIEFDGNTDKLIPASDAALEVVHDYLDAKPDVTLVRIEGHTDTEGNVATNQTLSEKRALTVARWLVGVGVKCERLVPVGFGGTRPIAPNDTKANRAQNRRIVIATVAVKGAALPSAVAEGGKVAGDPCK